MDESKILQRLVQIGTVTAVQGTKARVLFQDSKMTSGWLSVLQRPGEAVRVTMKEAGDPSHVHTASGSVTGWTPNVNDVVLVLYLPVSNSDGFILGKVV